MQDALHRCHPAENLVARLAEAGVRIGDLGRGRLRAVTHYGLTRQHIHDAVRIIGAVWKELSG